MKHEGLIVGLLVVAVAISAAGLVLGVARLPHASRAVAATGTAQKSFVPDIAHLDLGVQTDAPTVQKAQQDNLATMNGVLATLKAAGVKNEDIQTSNFYINQNFDYASGKSAKPTGWHVSNTVTVRVKPDLVSWSHGKKLHHLENSWIKWKKAASLVVENCATIPAHHGMFML